MTTRTMVIDGALITTAVRRMTYAEAVRSLPALTEEQHTAIVEHCGRLVGNSETGVEFEIVR